MIVKVGMVWLSNDMCLCGVCTKSKTCFQTVIVRNVCGSSGSCYKQNCELADIVEKPTDYFKCPCGKEWKMAVCPAMRVCMRWEECVFKLGGWTICQKGISYAGRRRFNTRRVPSEGGGSSSTGTHPQMEEEGKWTQQQPSVISQGSAKIPRSARTKENCLNYLPALNGEFSLMSNST